MYTSPHPHLMSNITPLSILTDSPWPGNKRLVCEAALYGPDDLDKMSEEELARYIDLLRINWSASYSE